MDKAARTDAKIHVDVFLYTLLKSQLQKHDKFDPILFVNTNILINSFLLTYHKPYF